MRKERRAEVIERDGYRCQKCGCRPPFYNIQVAHRVKNGSGTMKHIENLLLTKYGKTMTKKFIQDEIIDSPKNLVTTCCLECNGHYNIFNKPVQREALLTEIINDLGIV